MGPPNLFVTFRNAAVYALCLVLSSGTHALMKIPYLIFIPSLVIVSSITTTIFSTFFKSSVSVAIAFSTSVLWIFLYHSLHRPHFFHNTLFCFLYYRYNGYFCRFSLFKWDHIFHYFRDVGFFCFLRTRLYTFRLYFRLYSDFFGFGRSLGFHYEIHYTTHTYITLCNVSITTCQSHLARSHSFRFFKQRRRRQIAWLFFRYW